MKKLLITLAALLLLVVISVPVGLGILLQKATDTALSTLNQQDGIEATVISRRQGYFSSDLDLKVRFLNPASFLQPSLQSSSQAPQPIVVTTQFHLQHGPLIWSPYISFAWAHVTLVVQGESGFQPMFAFNLQEPLYSLEGKVNLLGDFHFTDRLAAFTLTLPDLKLSNSQSLGKGHLYLLEKKLEYAANQTQFLFENNSLRLTIANPQTTKWISLAEDRLTLRNSLAFDALVEDRAANVMLKKGRITLDAEPASQLSEQNLTLGVLAEEWKSNGMPLNNVDINILFQQVPSEFIQQLAGLKLSGPAEQWQPELFNTVKNYLLPAKPQIIIDRFRLGPDAKTAQLHLVLDLPTTVDMDWAQLSAAAANWVPLVTLKGDVIMDKNLAQMLAQNIALAQYPQEVNQQTADMVKNQAVMMTGLFLGQGLISEENGLYKTQFSLEKGSLILNQKPFLLPF